MRLVDEALVAATAGELSPIVTGIVYCNTIAFCRDAYELRHAREWTEALTRWCDGQPEMVAHNGLCLVHRAEIMQLQGAWEDALVEARRAAERFTQGVLNQLACGKALYREGEVHRLRGEFGAAEDAYREASRCGCEPQPGLALLRLAEGKAWAAAGAIRRVVGETTQPLKRAGLLPAYVDIMLAVGDVSGARGACVSSRRSRRARGATSCGAMAASARGAVALAEGDPRRRWSSCARAFGVWQELEAPYEAARARVLSGSPAGRWATRTLRRWNWRPLGRCSRSCEAARLARIDSRAPEGVVRRYARADRARAEVLRLVAAGSSNRRSHRTGYQRAHGRPSPAEHLRQARRLVADRGERLRVGA